MSVTPETIDHIARLARLSFRDEEKALFAEQFNKILTYIEKLNKVDTTNVEPLAQVTSSSNVLREDVPGACLSVEDALRNAPARLESFIKVPKVVE